MKECIIEFKHTHTKREKRECSNMKNLVLKLTCTHIIILGACGERIRFSLQPGFHTKLSCVNGAQSFGKNGRYTKGKIEGKALFTYPF